jgi:hypothetical protein
MSSEYFAKFLKIYISFLNSSIIMSKNDRSFKVGGGTDPTPLSDEVKNKNKLTIFNIFLVLHIKFYYSL